MLRIYGHYPNGPFFGQKTEAYEGGVHVPLIIRWPGIVKAGSKSDKIVALTDVLATMAELMNQPTTWNTGEDSFSFLYELQGSKPKQPIRENIVMDSKSELFAIREGDWKFIAGKGGGGYWNEQENTQMMTHQWNYEEDHDNPPGQLFNLKIDPGETTILYYSYPKIVVQLRAKLREIEYNCRSK
jgi:arylsulfatase A